MIDILSDLKVRRFPESGVSRSRDDLPVPAADGITAPFTSPAPPLPEGCF